MIIPFKTNVEGTAGSIFKMNLWFNMTIDMVAMVGLLLMININFM